MIEQPIDTLALSNKAIRGTLWSYASRYGGKFVVFISTIILARLLSEEDFGVASYAIVFISFLEMLRGMGIGQALIYFPQGEDRPETGFWLVLLIGITLCGLTWFLAPWVGVYFNDARAVPVVRAMGFTFPINALSVVHDAVLRKQMAFNKRFVPELARPVSKGVLSIILALLGFAAWSIILGHLFGAIVAFIGYRTISTWRPRFRFNRAQWRPLLAYGMRIVSVDFLAVLLNNVDYLLIGRYLGAVSLGVYTLAFRIPEITIKQFYILTAQVTFPAYTQLQSDRRLLKKGFLTTLRYITLATAPIAIGLALVSRPFVLVFLTEKWSEAIAVIPAIAIYTFLRSIGFSAGNVYKATGKPQILTQIKLVQAVIAFPALWWAATVAGSIVVVAWVQVGISLFAAFLNLLFARKILETSFREILISFWPAFICSVSMALVVLGMKAITASMAPWIQLFASVGVGGITYVAVLWWLQRDVVLKANATLRAAIMRK